MFSMCFNTFFIKNYDGADSRGTMGSPAPPPGPGVDQGGSADSASGGPASGSQTASMSFSDGPVSAPLEESCVSHENGQQQRPYSEPAGEEQTGGGGSWLEGHTGSVVSLEGRYLVLSLNKYQLDKACKNRDFPETAVIRLTFDANIREPLESGNGNGAESVTGSASGSEEHRSEEGSPDEDESSDEEDASCVRMWDPDNKHRPIGKQIQRINYNERMMMAVMLMVLIVTSLCKKHSDRTSPLRNLPPQIAIGG